MELVGSLFFWKCQDVHHRPDKVAAVNESAPLPLEPRAKQKNKLEIHSTWVKSQSAGELQGLLWTHFVTVLLARQW